MDRKDLTKAKKVLDKSLKTSKTAIDLFNQTIDTDPKQAMEYLEVAQEANELAVYTFSLYEMIQNRLERETAFGFVQE